nr:hypothetical protein [Streptomyces sp. SID4948]
MVLAAATGLAGVLALSGCGVPPSGVIQAGEPATGMPAGITVFFLSSTGSLVGVPRFSPPDLATAVDLLFQGPTSDEAPELSTRLPKLPALPEVEAKDGTILIRVPPGVARFTPPAMQQLVCTAATAYRVEPDSAAHRQAGTPRVPTFPPVPVPAPGVGGSVPTGLAVPPMVSIHVVGARWAQIEVGHPCGLG